MNRSRGASGDALLAGNYTLVICEKPDAAKRIAEALSRERPDRLNLDKTEVYVVEREGVRYAVCSAVGHLYTVGDPAKRREVYPVFDIEWFPTHLMQKEMIHIGRRIDVIAKLSRRAAVFINACDFDIEGETIGYNILRYACGGKENAALRAKFSTLTRDELIKAFAEARAGLGAGLAEAGRTRHVVDFIWGVNLSRALSEAFYSASKRYKTISVGRVQGPTLAYVVDREVEIRSFVPTPYWTIVAVLELDGLTVKATYEKDTVETLREATEVKEKCGGRQATVIDISESIFRQASPTPFNTGDLQREAYRVFGFPPNQTLGIAERLYLGALISYPRTSSQKLPPSIGYRQILGKLAQTPSYRDHAGEILLGRIVPHEGDKEDPAHPAIYPTGERPSSKLSARESRVYDLIVRRFLAAFGEDTLRQRVSASIGVEDYSFKILGRRTLKEGWVKYYRQYTEVQDSPIPPLSRGDVLRVQSIEVNEKLEQHSPRYNQSSLLERMEKDVIGTKTTRADIINTLFERGYVVGESITATDIGFSVIETMRRHSPNVVSLEMTKEVERDLEGIETGKMKEDEVIEKSIERIKDTLATMRNVAEEIGKEIVDANISTILAKNTLGVCPVCKSGSLRIIRSRKTHKRFAGCTNYRNGCRATAPLPQRGAIKATSKVCRSCGWPIIYVRLGRFPWRLCVNIKCPTKEARKNAVQIVQKRSKG